MRLLFKLSSGNEKKVSICITIYLTSSYSAIFLFVVTNLDSDYLKGSFFHTLAYFVDESKDVMTHFNIHIRSLSLRKLKKLNWPEWLRVFHEENRLLSGPNLVFPFLMRLLSLCFFGLYPLFPREAEGDNEDPGVPLISGWANRMPCRPLSRPGSWRQQDQAVLGEAGPAEMSGTL